MKRRNGSRAISRVALRAPTAEDEAAFLRAVQQSRALHGSWVNPPRNPAEFRQFLARVGSEMHCPFLVVERATGDLVGAIGIGQIIRGPLQSAFLGYYAFAGFDRRGLMTEAMRQALDHAFRKLKLHRIEANIQPGNRASRNFIRQFGFRCEGFSPRYLKVRGRWRDHERWALVAELRRGPSRRANSGSRRAIPA